DLPFSDQSVSAIPPLHHYAPCHLPVLLSFPTRRSSDLCHGGDRLCGCAGHRPPDPRPDPVSSRARVHREPTGFGRGSGGRCPAQDRKSTRLNSSHLVISYAVFCLKKKKKHIMIILSSVH